MSAFFSRLFLIASVFASLASGQGSPTSAPIYITHVTVIDTGSGKESPDRTVVINGDRISEIKASKGVKIPSGSKVVDGTGKYLIPGLWDMHVHVWDYDSTFPLFLANGVTGVRDMFGPADANTFRAELAVKKLDAPHFYLASPIIDGHPKVWPTSIEVNTPEEARKVVDEQEQKGSDFIKVYSRLSRESYFAIAEESRRQKIPFEGHVPTLISAWEASNAGQKSFEHLNGIPLACSSRQEELQPKIAAAMTVKERYQLIAEGSRSHSDEKCQRLFAEFKKNGTWQVPTLTVNRSFAMLNNEQFRKDERLRYFGGDYRNWLVAKDDFRLKAWTDEDFDVQRELFAYDEKAVGAMFRAGAPMLAGTDAGNPFCFPGFSLHDELALMVESGVSPLGALQAATRNPAIFMEATDNYGSVTPGKLADLVLLDADPLKDIHNTTKISEVFLAGKEFDRAALDQMLKAAETAATSQPANQTKDIPAPVFIGQTEGDFIVRDFHFNSGEVLPELRLHYVTMGTPHLNASGEIDNAVLLLHSTGGDTTEFFEPDFSGPLYGPGQPFDLSKFYVIIPDSIGHGKSSKPSDGMRAHFPHYGYEDMVAAQHRLVTEKLGVTHLRLVMGLSMGGMHTWLWGERYAEMMDGLFPISALPVETGGRNRLWRHTIVEMIRNDPEWKNGDYQQQPHGYSRIVPLVAMMVGNPVRQFEKYPTRAAADAWYDLWTHGAYQQADANDRLYQYDASSDYNPAPDLDKIKAKLLLIVFEDDQINSPEFAALDREMPRVKNGRYVIVTADKESDGEGNNTVAKVWRSHLEELLRSITIATPANQSKKPPQAPSPDGEVSADIAQLTLLATEAGHAYARRDLAALERFTADDYVQTDVRGGLSNRAQWMEFVRNRKSELTVETDDVHVSYYGNGAVVTGHWIYRSKETGKDAISHSRWTSVWTRYSDGWKRHAFQNTYVKANADRCAKAVQH